MGLSKKLGKGVMGDLEKGMFGRGSKILIFSKEKEEFVNGRVNDFEVAYSAFIEGIVLPYNSSPKRKYVRLKNLNSHYQYGYDDKRMREIAGYFEEAVQTPPSVP